MYCYNNTCIRRGLRGSVQKLWCKCCKKWQQNSYCNRRYSENEENKIRRYHNEGLGTSSIARLLYIPTTSVQNLMEKKAAKLFFQPVIESDQIYEVDEAQTFVGRNRDENRIYVITALNKLTSQIIGCVVGKRRQTVVEPLIDQLLALHPKRIYTDKCSIYPGLIPKVIHRHSTHLINHIERLHYTFRQRIKRLSRKTMSYSKSERMLNVSVKLFCCD
jgi:insertion element IS1 protein InsB